MQIEPNQKKIVDLRNETKALVSQAKKMASPSRCKSSNWAVFLELRKKHQAIKDAGERLEADLILLEANDKSEEFDDLIDEIIMLFDSYCPDPYLCKDYEFIEEELKKWKEDGYQKLRYDIGLLLEDHKIIRLGFIGLGKENS